MQNSKFSLTVRRGLIHADSSCVWGKKLDEDRTFLVSPIDGFKRGAARDCLKCKGYSRLKKFFDGEEIRPQIIENVKSFKNLDPLSLTTINDIYKHHFHLFDPMVLSLSKNIIDFIIDLIKTGDYQKLNKFEFGKYGALNLVTPHEENVGVLFPQILEAISKAPEKIERWEKEYGDNFQDLKSIKMRMDVLSAVDCDLRLKRLFIAKPNSNEIWGHALHKINKTYSCGFSPMDTYFGTKATFFGVYIPKIFFSDEEYSKNYIYKQENALGRKSVRGAH